MAFKTHPDRENRPRDAYQHVHENGKLTSTCIAIVGELAFLGIHLNFGTITAPEECTTISEATMDLGNDLLSDAPWETTNLQFPHRQLIPR